MARIFVVLILISLAGCKRPIPRVESAEPAVGFHPLIDLVIINRIRKNRDTPPKAQSADVDHEIHGAVIPPLKIEPIAEPEQPKSAKQTALDDYGIWFDIDSLIANLPKSGWKMPAPVTPSRRVQFIYLTIEHCPPCEKQDKELALMDPDWIKADNENAHFRKIKVDDQDKDGWIKKLDASEFPLMVLMSDGVEVSRHAGVTSRQILVSEFNVAVNSLRPLMKSSYVPAFAAGEMKLDKDKLDMILQGIGHEGKFILPNDAILISKQGVEITIKKHSMGQVTTTGTVRHITFDPTTKPSAAWGWISASADAFSLDESNYTLTAEIPGLPIHPSLKLLAN